MILSYVFYPYLRLSWLFELPNVTQRKYNHPNLAASPAQVALESGNATELSVFSEGKLCLPWLRLKTKRWVLHPSLGYSQIKLNMSTCQHVISSSQWYPSNPIQIFTISGGWFLQLSWVQVNGCRQHWVYQINGHWSSIPRVGSR